MNNTTYNYITIIKFKNIIFNLLNLGLGTKSKYKQKQVEALSLDESMKPEAPCFS